MDVQETSVPHQRTVESVRFRVEDGVYESAMAAGVPTQILIEAYRQLRNRVDFQRDIRLGDELSFVFEMFRHERNEIRHAGQLLAASIDQQAERIAIYRFAPGGGNSAFYNSAGVSVETVLSRTPVEGARLSSLFGERDHPILGYTRMHEGLDFAARHGTPVVAAGSGRVVRASRYGSFGKYVRIRHDPEFETAYAHLSRYANGLTAGDQVRQGQVIGYVGASGTATGPNLHYEVLRDGAPVNPRTLDLPPSQKLTGETLDEFRNHVRNLEPVLNGAAKSTYANLDAHSETPTTTGDL
ncbi:M23 family metallopeptidase [Aquisalimonas lutea]|uniref:M23 family metallopeptidase n=1 Tax=Aquisalimonas lutea TaxID=1327750 RepID=UPI0025B4EC6F|nr:M23 family metallopeptidase [Aquisalimonas lutea]MDN3519096.1 M23 family metallopeptidase [Aquisalimonas lutea]